MTGFLLDTNAWIAFLNGHSGMAAHIRRAGLPNLSLCAPVWAELWFGACKSKRVEENQARLRELATCVASLPFDDHAAEHCADIRAVLTSALC
jgi:tRNA(fMet)-specific endonuclease VapC